MNAVLRRRFVPAATRKVLPLAALLAFLILSTSVRAAAPVDLGTATGFAVLAGGTITNTGSTTITGDVGVSPSTTPIAGFDPPAAANHVTLYGTSYEGGQVAVDAQADLLTAYQYAQGLTGTPVSKADLGGMTLTAGVYYSTAAFALTTPLVLDGLNDPTSVFIFQTPAALNTTASTAVTLINGANACNVFWQVGGAVTLGASTAFKGTIMASGAITLGNLATIDGRALALYDAVTMDTNIIDAGACGTPSLTLVKAVTSDNGGTASASDWTLSAGTHEVAGSAAGALATDQAGTYALTESTGPAGYANTSITCDDAPGVEVSSVTLGLGEAITCTFVNDDIAPSLTLVKAVTSDNGGTASASDWTLSAGTHEVAGSAAGALATDQAGTYALTESTGPAGYANTSITCDDAPGVEVSSVTLGLGEAITCTFVNDDIAPSLTLVKAVTSDNGGTASASDWTLSAGTHEVAGSAAGALATDQAGTYALTESTGPAGYANTSITCDDAPGVEVSSVTLGLGEAITCTFVNDDIAPSLTLVKAVTSDNGGTASASDWTLSAGTHEVAGSAAGALATDQAGTYALTESTGPAGYANTSITCDDAPGVEVSSVTLGLGEAITCTFVNDDIAPSLTLVKAVTSDNGGTASASDWTLSAGTHEVAGSAAGALATDQAGTYALTESTGPAGYANTSITCDDAPGSRSAR